MTADRPQPSGLLAGPFLYRPTWDFTVYPLRIRHLWTVILISLCLFVLCAITAISLVNQQASLSGVLRENFTSHRAAAELEECLFDLITLLQHRVEEVSSLNERIEEHLKKLHHVADQQHEKVIFAELEQQIREYLRRFKELPPPRADNHELAVRELARFLEMAPLRKCREFEWFNDSRVGHSIFNHDSVLVRLAWGMAGIGVVGAVAGLVLGFGVARHVSQSIHRLQVQIRHAAGKIDQVQEIRWIEGGDFRALHEQVDQLTRRIEKVMQQLHDRETEVLRAEQLAAVGQLAAGVAHEIRNPLTSIKLLVQSGLEDPDGLVEEDLQVIESEVLRMEQSLQTFLDFARPSQPEPRPMDAGALLRGVVALIRGRAEKQGVVLEVEVPASPLPLLADRKQLHQVLVNLCLNALDAMPTGGRLALRVNPVRDGRLSIEVIDTGTGIAPDLLPRLFHPFVSTKDTGLGLGLVISLRIVEAHGGMLTAANRPGGGGAIFTVDLPTTQGVQP